MMSENIIDVLWSTTVYDIKSTLRAAIGKIMRDNATDTTVKEQRAMALLQLGKIYQQFGDSSEESIKEMKKAIAMKMRDPVVINEDEYDFCE